MSSSSRLSRLPPLFNPMFRLSERFSLTAPHRTGLAVFPHPALQQEIRSVSACQIDVRPLQRVYFHDLLEFRPCQPAGLVSSSLCLEEFPFDIAVEFLQAYPVAIDSVIAIMPYEFLIQGLNRFGNAFMHMLPQPLFGVLPFLDQFLFACSV